MPTYKSEDYKLSTFEYYLTEKKPSNRTRKLKNCLT